MQPERASSTPAARIYVAIFLLSIAGMAASLLLLGRTDWFLDHSGYPALRGVGYSQHAGRQNCGILIYGDSSSLAALDPLIIQQATGIKTCNVSEGTPVQAVVGTDPPLQRYLAQNPRPRILLTTWTPSFFKPDQDPLFEYHVEGMWYAYRYGEWSKLLSGTLLAWTPDFVSWELKSLLDGLMARLFKRPANTPDLRLTRLQHAGYLPYTMPPETHCVRTYRPGDLNRWESSAQTFRQKYSTPQTHVIVNISPVPDCDPLFALYKTVDRGLYDNQFQQLPIRDFSEGDVHLGPAGSRLISQQAAAQVLAALGNQPAGN